MAKLMDRVGFGQVEPNQLISIITAEFIDMVPVDKEKTGDILEQGRFLREKIMDGQRTLTIPSDEDAFGPVVMVYNEEHFYDERDGYHKDFALKAEDFYDGVLVPRCFRPVVLDKLTTNCFVKGATSKNEKVETELELEVGDSVKITGDGYFCAAADSDFDESPEWIVEKVYTMPDGQAGVKLRCIAR